MGKQKLSAPPASCGWMRLDCLLEPELAGVSAGGAGAEYDDVARAEGIAVIARHRRHQKGKSLPLINADDTDRERLPKSPESPESENQNLTTEARRHGENQKLT